MNKKTFAEGGLCKKSIAYLDTHDSKEVTIKVSEDFKKIISQQIISPQVKGFIIEDGIKTEIGKYLINDLGRNQ